METKYLTVMFTDLKGFTQRTSEQSRQATLDMIRKHKELIAPIIEEQKGTIIKTIGDSFLATFESPTNAVLTGMKLQEKLKNHNHPINDSEKLEIRVAINTGEVTLEDNDVYGEAVNIAARVEGIADPNEIYFTESTYLAMNKAEVPTAEIGYRIFKGITEKIKIFKVLREGETKQSILKTEDSTTPGSYSSTIASPWRRGIAILIDIILFLLIAKILPSMSKSISSFELFGFKVALSTGVIIYYVYLVITLIYFGKSLGKKIMSLKVVQVNDEKITHMQAYIRPLFYFLYFYASIMPYHLNLLPESSSTIKLALGQAILLIIVLIPVLDKKKMVLHDKILGTKVIGDKNN